MYATGRHTFSIILPATDASAFHAPGIASGASACSELLLLLPLLLVAAASAAGDAAGSRLAATLLRMLLRSLAGRLASPSACAVQHQHSSASVSRPHWSLNAASLALAAPHLHKAADAVGCLSNLAHDRLLRLPHRRCLAREA